MQEQERALLRQTRAVLRSVAMLVDFALEFEHFEINAFGQKGEFSWVREIFWERGVSKVHR